MHLNTAEKLVKIHWILSFTGECHKCRIWQWDSLWLIENVIIGSSRFLVNHGGFSEKVSVCEWLSVYCFISCYLETSRSLTSLLPKKEGARMSPLKKNKHCFSPCYAILEKMWTYLSATESPRACVQSRGCSNKSWFMDQISLISW